MDRERREKNTLNCAYLACPQPVIETKRFLDKNKDLKALCVIVDNAAAMENVSRLLKSQDFEVNPKKIKQLWHLMASKADTALSSNLDGTLEKDKINKLKTLALILSDKMGSGDDELGSKLMVNFLSTLPELGNDLWRIVLLNGGVKLACTGHPALDKLKDLQKKGVSILVCGTCLEHFKMLKKKEIGDTTNMLDVVSSLDLADKILRI